MGISVDAKERFQSAYRIAIARSCDREKRAIQGTLKVSFVETYPHVHQW